MPTPLKEFLKRWAVTTVGVLVAAHTLAGIHYDKENWQTLLIATLILGLLNAFLRPLLLLLSLPLLLFSLGLFTTVINAGLLYFVGQVVKGFHVDTFWDAFKGGLIISVVSVVLNLLTGSGSARVSFQRGKPPPPSKGGKGGNDGGNGPVIDI